MSEKIEDLEVLVQTDSDNGNEDVEEQQWAEILYTNQILIKSEDGKNELSSEQTPYNLPLRRSDIEEESEFKRFVKACERMIRQSPEYRVWTDYIREILGEHSCAITGEVHSQTTVDIHHHPVSLYTIVKAVLNQYMGSDKEFCTFDIATKVIELHYQNKVGYVPLIRSLHIKFDNGFLLIPMELVLGDYKTFLKDYTDFLEEEDLDVINGRLAINKENCGWGDGYNWGRDSYKGKENK